ncbi:MAG: site-specific integrase [Clostridiales bacterium]|nr:site-specific integrase [Clostridiales bacterium]
MPTSFRNVFAVNDLIVHYRLRKDGVYEARFHRQGIDIEVSSKDLTMLKKKFVDRLNGKDESRKSKKADKSKKTFAEYADEWLNIKRVTTKQSTYNEYVRMLNHDILPVFGKKPVLEIDRSALQSFLLTYVDNGTIRTADKLFLVLRCIFDVVADDYCISSPMKKVIVPNYQSKKGSAFTYEEEQQLINYCLSNLNKDTSHALMVLLYTGLRRSELASLNVINGIWLECDTSKERMGKNVVKRKIPFTPMMKRVLPYLDFEKAKNVNLSSLHTTMKRVFPQRHLHELRYTFITRCKECGVHGEVVMLWDGHEEDKTVHSSRIDRGYTDFSDEFMLREAEKVDYQKWDFPI